jgi:hypothetical protein
MKENKLSEKIILYLIGCLYILLPIVISLVGFIKDSFLPVSISYTYYSDYNYVFIVFSFLMPILLIIYNLISKQYLAVNIVISILILLILIFPTGNINNDNVGIFHLSSVISDKLHITFVFIYLVTITYLFIFKFGLITKTNKNKILLILGVVIFGLVIGLALGRVVFNLNDYFPFSLYLEVLIFIIIGIGYIIKGKDIKKGDLKNEIY